MRSTPSAGELCRFFLLEVPELAEEIQVACGYSACRWGFRTLIDEATGIAWELYRHDIESLDAPADKAYAELLNHHAQDHFAHMPKELADDMLTHFRDRNCRCVI
jgi:hypothetical protein